METQTIIWYVLFFVVDYLLLQMLFKKEFEDSTISWSQGDRMISIFISLFSWISFIIGLILIILLVIEDHFKLNDKKANW